MTGFYRRQPSSVPPRRSLAASTATRCKDAALVLSLIINAVLLWTSKKSKATVVPFQFSGGYPEVHPMAGNCYCSSQDNYCMCNPSLTIDLVIVVEDKEEILLVRRKDTNQLATMGGFVDMGETVEEAVWRELKEETGITALDNTPRLFGVYSDPARDNRRHTAAAVFAVHVNDSDALHKATAADDVKGIVRIPWNEIEQHDFYSDHKTILQDYVQFMKANGAKVKGQEVTRSHIKRSLCAPSPPLISQAT